MADDINQVIVGRVIPKWMGEYDPSKTYNLLEVVTLNGATYEAITDSVTSPPPDNTKWLPLSSGVFKEKPAVLQGSQTITSDDVEYITISTSGQTSLTFVPADKSVFCTKTIKIIATATSSLEFNNARWADYDQPPSWGGDLGESLIIQARFVDGDVVLSVIDNTEIYDPYFVPIKWLGYYGNNTDVFDLMDYQLMILESDNMKALKKPEGAEYKCVAYLNISEVNNTRWYYPQVDKSIIVEENPDWPGAFRINTADIKWQNFLLSTVAPKILDEYKYDGIFFDAVDTAEYLESLDPKKYAGAIRGTSNIIKAFRKKYPHIIIICNGGYKPVIEARQSVTYYVRESTISTWKIDDKGNTIYVSTDQTTKNIVYPKLREIKGYGIPILDWEYGNVKDIANTQLIMNNAQHRGWSAFVTDKNIDYFPRNVFGKISFKASKDGTNINFFENGGSTLPAASNFMVSINDVVVDQPYTSLTFKADDKVDIQLTEDQQYYPKFQPGHWDTTKILDYISDILEPLPSMKADPSWSITDMNNAFTGCTLLKTIPEGMFKNNFKMTSYYYCFSGSGITEVPTDMFKNNRVATNFAGCFQGCLSLQEVAENAFADCVKATDFSYLFDKDENLISIPAELFKNNTAVTTFSFAFGECKLIQEIPDGLFNTNVNVTDFSDCFTTDTGINYIPADLFLNNTKVTTFNGCFAWCNAIPVFDLKIGSTVATDFTNFVTEHWQGKRTLYVTAGSTTESSVKAANLDKTTISTDMSADVKNTNPNEASTDTKAGTASN